MQAPLRIVQLNLAYDPAVADPEALLARYRTLTGLSEALAQAGASVSVLQRFSSRHTLHAGGVPYELLPDGGPPMAAPSATSEEIVAAATATHPDAIHINGLM